MAIQSNFPAIRPSLLLDFANSKRLDPRITFTRASTARYYDGSTVAKAEENLFVRSQEFATVVGGWGNSNVVVTSDSTAAPDGTTTADTVTADAGTGTRQISQGPTVASGSTVVMSFFVKAGTHNYVQLLNSGDAQAFANFDVTAGAGVVGTLGSKTTSSIVDAGGGWYRCIAIFNSTVAYSNTWRLYIAPSASATYGQAITAAGTETVILWGAQLEVRSAVTAYTATTTAPITNYVPQLLTAQNNVPRFDHNPTTGESLGLLIEEQRTNLALQSEAFGTTWGATRSFVTTNILVGPDGTLTADKVYENTTASNSHYVAQTISLTSGTSYTFSVYAKAGERTQVRLRVDGTAMFANAQFNLSSGVVSSGTGTITNVGNGWYRCSVTGTSDLTGSNTVAIYLLDGSGATNYTGDGYSGLYVWGAQLEAGAFATSYIPTTAASATRQADAASMTGTNFSSWYDAAEGTMYGEAFDIGRGSLANIDLYSISDGLNSNRISGSLGTDIHLIVRTNDVTQANLDAGTPTVGAFNKIAGAYKVNDFAVSLNGGAVVTDTVGTIPVVNQFIIGALPSSARRGAYVRKLAYYPLRLTNAQLQAITG